MKKKILGITVLLAVLAMCLTFTACPPAEDNAVNFFNYTGVDVTVNIKGGITFTLPKIVGLVAQPTKNTVTKKGDIVLQTVDFGNLTFDQVAQYIIIDGSATGGKKKYADGINLGSGTINFRADQSVDGNLALPSIDEISLDD